MRSNEQLAPISYEKIKIENITKGQLYFWKHKKNKNIEYLLCLVKSINLKTKKVKVKIPQIEFFTYKRGFEDFYINKPLIKWVSVKNLFIGNYSGGTL